MRRLGMVLVVLVAGCEDLPPEVTPPVVAVVSQSPSVAPSAVARVPTPVKPSVRPSATPTPVPSVSTGPRATRAIAFAGNLDARVPTRAPETPEGPLNFVDVNGTAYDERGGAHCVVVRFTHTGANDWAWQIYAPDATAVTPNPESPPLTLAFDAQGRLEQPESGALDFVWTLPSGEMTGATIRLDVAREGVTQHAVASTLSWVGQDGAGTAAPCE